MKINKKRVLEFTSSNKNIVFGVIAIILVFSICLLPLFDKGTYSVDETADDSLTITCPETVFAGESIECSIVLNSVTISTQGISAKYQVTDGMEYVGFTLGDDWNIYEDINYSDSDGFVLVSEGVMGNSIVGIVKYVIPDDAKSDEIYKIELIGATIGDGEDVEIELDDTYAEVKIVADDSELSDVNTLESITLTGGKINEVFDKNKNNYTATADGDKITVEVVKTDENSILSGDLGELTLHAGTNELSIVVTSESGKVNTYTIEVNKTYSLEFDDSLDIDDENKYIKYIIDETTVEELLDKIYVTGSDEVAIYGSDNNVKNSADVLASGDILTIYLDDEIKHEYVISVMGDSNGDGVVDLIDLVQIRKHIVGWIDPNTNKIYEKTGIYYFSLDMNKDGIIDLVDLVRMRKIIVGMI